ncbi:MAG: cytochrome c oxidase subunit 1 [Candidatus Hydrogenedentota bacterium]
MSIANTLYNNAEYPARNYLSRKTIASWLLTTDHKRIAVLYLVSISAFFLVGALFAAMIRIELLTPSGDFMSGDTYNKAFTLHGVVMIFFFLIPSIPAVLGNFLVPIMVGAKDLAFPKINLLSYYIYVVAGIFAVGALLAGGVDTGWTFYTPFSTTYAKSSVFLAVTAAFISGFSSILTGLNFIVTIHKMRAPGLTWFRLPLFVWAHYATSLIQVLGTPVVAITLFLTAVERVWGVGIFDPELGGDPVLFQHMFWFYSHPAVYIMILPAMGVMSEVIACFSRRRVFGYEFVAFSSLAIAIVGFLVWGHHMFVSSQSTFAGIMFSLITMLVAIPSAIKVFNWSATLYKGEVTFEAPMLYAFSFIGLFTIGGLTGIFLGLMGMDIHFHDTYFVVAHFHYVMVGGMVIGFLMGMHFWWPKMTGRMYNEYLAQIAAILAFIGFNLTFFPQFILGYLGMPRRYHVYPDEFQVLNVLSTAGASILGIAYLLPMIYLPWSLVFGKVSGPNPWNAKGLEWEHTTSPPDTFNFDKTPIVTEEAYAYSATAGEH